MKAAILTTLAAILITTSAIAQGLTGNYSAHGRNADGSAYAGVAAISDTGAQVGITWTVGGQSYAGSGQLHGRVLSINWGAAEPVIYVLMPDGSLHGTWDHGRALEKLTRQ